MQPKTILEIATSHPLAGDVDTAVTPTAVQDSVNTETKGNESGENKALKGTDMDGEPADDMDDSDLSDDSSVAEGNEAKKGNDSKKGNEAKKGQKVDKKRRVHVCIYRLTSCFHLYIFLALEHEWAARGEF